MKIIELHAENVHGYLPINIKLFDDLTFLTGLNGSGKTTALRLLMALLTPNIEELAAIDYSKVVVTVKNGSLINIQSTKTANHLMLSISNREETLKIPGADLEFLREGPRRDGSHSPVIRRYLAHPVYQTIKKMPAPMFLGLDRRFFIPRGTIEDAEDMNRREYISRRYWQDEPNHKNTAFANSLMEVNYLVITRMQDIRSKQEKLDERLRANFFTKAFEYKPSVNVGGKIQLPSRSELNAYREQLNKIEQASEGVKIPVPEIQSALTLFFEKMSLVVDSLEKSGKSKANKKKASEKANSTQAIFDPEFIEWIINKPQVDRIIEHLHTLEKYIEDRNALPDPIDRFLMLVNQFFTQTNKKVSVAITGQLTVSIDDSDLPRSIGALSSGEGQLMVMLAHLSLNQSLTGSGVFIVDEPELSLHLAWQEKFVDAIQEANPNVQIILATHSPAIILDRNAAECSMS